MHDQFETLEVEEKEKNLIMRSKDFFWIQI